MGIIFDGLIWYFAFFLSLALHEAAHASAARKLGDETAYKGLAGLNPLPRIKEEPVGTVVFPILSYLFGAWMLGWGGAPYEPRWAIRNPKKAALMSMAGPAANLGIVIGAYVAIRFGTLFGYFKAPAILNLSHITVAANPGIFVGIAHLVSILFCINILLFVFNLIPLPPLDGSGILLSFLDERSARRFLDFSRKPILTLIALIIAWQSIDFIFRPIFQFAINQLYPGGRYK
ncbi:MAG: site-2 protease family protein [bacterium]|nr:site-2 protease family protein [bacterium]